ncbi:MAG: DoxX family protein [Alistipes sp.]|nr:DoxX family protein [Alistipes sp.]
MLRYAIHALRWLLGAVLIFSATTKFIDPVGTSIFVEKYLATYSLEALMPVAVAIAVVLSMVEFTLGVMLIASLRRRVVALFALVMVALFTIVTLLSATVLPLGECGCFGEVVSLTPWGTFLKNVILLIVAYVVWRSAEYGTLCRRDVVVALLALVSSLGVNLFALRHQPLVDLMPYSVSTDLRHAVSCEREAEHAHRVLSFRNSVTGTVEEFPIDATECWMREELEYLDVVTSMPSTAENKYADFRVYDAAGVDVGETLLSREGRVAWITVYDGAALADSERIEAIGRLYEIYPPTAIVVLSSTSELNAELFPNTNIYNADTQTLRSINRAKVGVVIINDGVVEYKADIRDI